MTKLEDLDWENMTVNRARAVMGLEPIEGGDGVPLGAKVAMALRARLEAASRPLESAEPRAEEQPVPRESLELFHAVAGRSWMLLSMKDVLATFGRDDGEFAYEYGRFRNLIAAVDAVRTDRPQQPDETPFHPGVQLAAIVEHEFGTRGVTLEPRAVEDASLTAPELMSVVLDVLTRLASGYEREIMIAAERSGVVGRCESSAPANVKRRARVLACQAVAAVVDEFQAEE